MFFNLETSIVHVKEPRDTYFNQEKGKSLHKNGIRFPEDLSGAQWTKIAIAT